jgi:cell division protein FtsW
VGSKKTKRRRASLPVEHSLLLTATLCLLAFGVVMVFSASSTTSLLGESGDGAYYLKRTLIFGAAGLVILRLLSTHGLAIVSRLTTPLLALSFALLVVVLIPGVGVEVNGAQRWIGAGFFQVQPSEVAKLALVLYGAQLLATRPKMVRSIGGMAPFLAAVAVACLLVIVEPDLGTAMVLCLTAAAMLVAAGVRTRDLVILGGALGLIVLLAIALEPYRMARLTGFLDPSADPAGAGFQATQAKIALGSGGIFGVGLGESLQKAFYLPEAHTDMIAAVIGEELGFAGIVMLAVLFGLFGYAGLQIARRARDRYSKLLAAGVTCLVMVQAVVNLFAVLGLAPLTGVPLPLVSYGNSSMLVLLAGVGLLLNVAAGGRAVGMSPKRSGAGGARLRAVNGGRLANAGANTRKRSSNSGAKRRDSRRGNRGSRRSGARGRRRAAG